MSGNPPEFGASTPIDSAMPSTGKRMQAVYDQIAGEYAARTAAMPAELVNAGTRFLALAGPGARILDVGCGPGRDMAWFEAQGAAVTGVDLSAGMLRQAGTRVRGALVQMDMRRLAFPDRTFRGVWSSASLLHLPRAEAPGALAEMRRVLVPGGAFFLAIQEGEGEGWESGRFENVERFFVRYSQDEAE